MSMRHLLISSVIAFVSTSSGISQPYDFFWSDIGFGGGAVNSDLELDVRPGDELTVFLYVTAENSDYDQVCLDVRSLNAFAVKLISAEAFDFDISVGGAIIGSRWDECSLDSIDVFAVNEWCCSSKEWGISADYAGSGQFFDLGYDATADAFLFGRLDVLVDNRGCSTITTRTGDGGISNNGSPVSPSFASVRILADILLGDVNQDGAVNLLDVEAFLDTGGGQYVAEADVNCDGSINLLDVAPFIQILLGN